jgi:hypothetical protein
MGYSKEGAEGARNTSPKLAASAKLNDQLHILFASVAARQAGSRFNFGEVQNFAEVESSVAYSFCSKSSRRRKKHFAEDAS